MIFRLEVLHNLNSAKEIGLLAAASLSNKAFGFCK